ncbi:hypothetical protein PAMP_002047 [Pampus punctatissimus]
MVLQIWKEEESKVERDGGGQEWGGGYAISSNQLCNQTPAQILTVFTSGLPPALSPSLRQALRHSCCLNPAVCHWDGGLSNWMPAHSSLSSVVIDYTKYHFLPPVGVQYHLIQVKTDRMSVSLVGSRYGFKHSLAFIVLDMQNDCAAAELIQTELSVVLETPSNIHTQFPHMQLGRPISLIHCDITLPPALSTSPLPLQTPLIRFGPANATTIEMECKQLLERRPTLTQTHKYRAPVH